MPMPLEIQQRLPMGRSGLVQAFSIGASVQDWCSVQGWCSVQYWCKRSNRVRPALCRRGLPEATLTSLMRPCPAKTSARKTLMGTHFVP
jgi:hypothetical protein